MTAPDPAPGPAPLDQVAPIGRTIITLGRRWHTGEITLEQAVDQLLAAHPGEFIRYGARAQLRTWQGAHLRYRVRDNRIATRPADARGFRGQPIHLHLPAAGS